MLPSLSLTLLLSLCLSLTCCLLSHLSLAVSLYLWLPLSCWFALGSSLILSPLLTFLSSRAFVVLITCGSFMTMPPTRSSLSLYSMLYIYLYISVYVCVCLCLCVLCKAMQIWRVWQFPIMASRLVSSSSSSSSFSFSSTGFCQLYRFLRFLLCCVDYPRLTFCACSCMGSANEKGGNGNGRKKQKEKKKQLISFGLI